ncbi:UNVERIFIED_CONTAM: hypothetical protein Slati_3621100 [Sesamum latifolium]|uniref:Uncharacterized protein n=1 Tax=Sesamum latifolium TaxID=2727402 RepID=A0AAW2U0J7_9LAMI
MAAAMKKVNMITQIVRLKQVVQRWKTKSLSRRSSLLYHSSSSSDSDEPTASKRRTPSGSSPSTWARTASASSSRPGS